MERDRITTNEISQDVELPISSSYVPGMRSLFFKLTPRNVSAEENPPRD